MKEFFLVAFIFIGLFLIGLMCGMSVRDHQTNDFLTVRSDLINKCEKTLPRDQQCEIIITAKIKTGAKDD